MYFWNDVYLIWFEVGYQWVDYDIGGDNKGWKLILFQNIFIVMGVDFRLMLCFYVIGGEVDNKYIVIMSDIEDICFDFFNVGVMWEVWFQFIFRIVVVVVILRLQCFDKCCIDKCCIDKYSINKNFILLLLFYIVLLYICCYFGIYVELYFYLL